MCKCCSRIFGCDSNHCSLSFLPNKSLVILIWALLLFLSLIYYVLWYIQGKQKGEEWLLLLAVHKGYSFTLPATCQLSHLNIQHLETWLVRKLRHWNQSSSLCHRQKQDHVRTPNFLFSWINSSVCCINAITQTWPVIFTVHPELRHYIVLWSFIIQLASHIQSQILHFSFLCWVIVWFLLQDSISRTLIWNLRFSQC